MTNQNLDAYKIFFTKSVDAAGCTKPIFNNERLSFAGCIKTEQVVSNLVLQSPNTQIAAQSRIILFIKF